VKNQVDDFIIPLLKKDPNSRRAVVVLYSPVADSRVNKKETPSLISIFIKIIEKKLTLTIVIRSNDMFIGWPANIYQVYLLQKYVGEKLGIETGSITTISHSAHIFTEYDEEIKAALSKR
jgi:thymidylate synthase